MGATPSCSSTRFQTTYEELKLQSPLIERPGTALPDYLWGIETNDVGQLGLGDTSSFQTTYEELKPLHKVSYRVRNWSFQTTYEELKRLTRRQFLSNSRFQTTYEELKPVFIHNWPLCVTASRLPMRNWNLSLLHCSLLMKCFQTTYEELKLVSPSIQFSVWVYASRLPMRNWNFLKNGKIQKLRLASRLPMRNWNQNSKMV